MHLARTLGVLGGFALLGALGCGEDPTSANICPELPLYYAERDANGEFTGRLLHANGQELSANEYAAIRAASAPSDQPTRRCTTPIGTAVTDPSSPRPPPASGSGGSGGAPDGG